MYKVILLLASLGIFCTSNFSFKISSSKISRLLLIGLISCIALSCQKRDKKHGRIHLKSNSPVTAGSSLKVWIDNKNDDYYYEIFHPSKQSLGESYSTEHASGADQGWYTAKAYGFETVSDSIFVDVTIPSIPCSPPDDRMIIDNGPSFNLSSANHYLSNGHYFVEYQQNSKVFTMLFMRKGAPPESDVYRSKSSTSGMSEYDAWVRLYSDDEYIGTTGEPIYIEVSNGRITITLCNFKMKGYSGNEISVDAKMVF